MGQSGEICFMQLTSGGVEMLFGFSEAVARGKRSPEKLFRVLEMYEALRDLTPHFEAVFSGTIPASHPPHPSHLGP